MSMNVFRVQKSGKLQYKKSSGKLRISLTAFFILPVVLSLKVHSQGNPVLVIGENSGFGTYTAEILKAEGYNKFDLKSLAGTDHSILRDTD
jgi:hypothetical protein